MQPLYCGTSCTATRFLIRNFRGVGNGRNLRSQSRGETILLIQRHASSKVANLGKKPASKPLPYQPTPSKAQVDLRIQQQQQQKQQKQQQQQQETKSKKAPIADLLRDRWVGILGFGSALGCLGYFTASLAIYWRQDPAPFYPLGCEPDVPSGRPSIQSPYEFDLHLDKSEWRYGITKLRRKIGAHMRGHVLEVAIGTGRNMEFCNWDTVVAPQPPLDAPEQREEAKPSNLRRGPGSGKSGGQGPQAAQGTNKTVLSFTGVDISPGMLDIALQRVRLVVPQMADQIPKKPSFAMLAAKDSDTGVLEGGHVVSFLSNRLRLLQSDVQSALPAPPILSPPGPGSSSSSSDSSANPTKYDTILQTFGLCSVQDPVSLLSHMASSLQPETGRIILLEHGRSVWDFVNGLLDRGARAHHERFGCWWNRDIEVIVNEAARRIPGLEVIGIERPGWATAGTHVLVVLRMRDPSVVNSKNNNEVGTGGRKAVAGRPSVLAPSP